MKKCLIITLCLIGLGASAQKKQNPFPPKDLSKATKVAHSQQCSGVTAKGFQCKRLVHVTVDQFKNPIAVYCFSHKK